MKTLAYILVVCLIILAGCGGCGSTSPNTSPVIAAIPKPEPKPEPKVYYQQSVNSTETKELKQLNNQLYEENKKLKTILEQQFQVAMMNPDSISITSAMPPPPPFVTHSINTNNGTLVYKVDSILTIGVVSRVEARIIRQVSAATTNYLVSVTSHTTTGVIRSEIIRVGDIMDMDLIALQPEAFTITKINSGNQPVNSTSVTEWLWGVTPKMKGDYDLILKATINEQGNHIDKIVFDKKISVQNRPKKRYTTNFEIVDSLQRYEESTVRFILKEKQSDTYNVDWGGNGKLKLEFDGDVIIKEVGDYTINDDKSLFIYEWKVTPMSKDTLHYTLKIIGDYDETVIYDKQKVHVDKNPGEWFNRILDGAVKRWYWLFTALIFPIYSILQKKYFPHKRIFKKRVRRTPPKKTPKP